MGEKKNILDIEREENNRVATYEEICDSIKDAFQGEYVSFLTPIAHY